MMQGLPTVRLVEEGLGVVGGGDWRRPHRLLDRL